ncbi:hypothetical protein NLG97_g1110 [Lecanicillium saksenae]|uniref:Uncharacterized protein n=1 Tax=Lecanicillium saksenae TaxID=468837 RepID=A0ACC1R6M6_9HYPO|nr:hypothetical protein NLG97_g1110 [Lecanicillium saksenae]
MDRHQRSRRWGFDDESSCSDASSDSTRSSYLPSRTRSPLRLSAIRISSHSTESPFSSKSTDSPFTAAQQRRWRGGQYISDDADSVRSSGSSDSRSTSDPFDTPEPMGVASVLNGSAHEDLAYTRLAATNGTAPCPFEPHRESDSHIVDLTLCFQHISSQGSYARYSCEELRLADYLLGRSIRHGQDPVGIGLDKGPAHAGSLGPWLLTLPSSFGSDLAVKMLGLPSRLGLHPEAKPPETAHDVAPGNACPGTMAVSYAPFAIPEYAAASGVHYLGHHILFSDELQNWSTEELRLADYRKIYPRRER